MSLDQPIALSVIEEPQIINFTEPDGGENILEQATEEKNFLQIWERAQMKLENLQKLLNKDEADNKPQQIQKLREYLYIARQGLINTNEVLKNTSILAEENKDFYRLDHAQYSNRIPDEKLEGNYGGLIIEKQLQLQNSANKLQQAAEELKQVVEDSKIYYRKLENVQRKYKLTSYVDIASRMINIGLVNSIKVPPTTSAMTIQLNKETKELDWTFSNNLRLAINGFHYEPNTEWPFLNLTSVICQENLFRHLQREGVEQDDNYLINESSMRIPVKGMKNEKINFELTVDSEPGTKTPVWLPPLVMSAIPVKSTPLKKFRSAMKTADITFFLFEFIMKRFAATDICKVNSLFSNRHAVFKISSLFTSDVATAISTEDCIILSTPTHMKLPIRIEMNQVKVDHRLEHWADVTWFVLFRDAVYSYARTFGFPLEDHKNRLVVTCDDRTVEFEATRFTNEAYVSLSIGSIYQQFLWSNVRGFSLQSKLNFLFFANIHE